MSSSETNPDLLTLERAVAGRYTLTREIGRGGMGVVFLARDLSLERPVALKLLPSTMAAQPVLRERFLREARTAAGLSHPHIVPIHAVEARDAIAFIVMAFVDGETLADRVQRTGPLPAHEVARILREVAWALGYAHGHGIVHRDIKPDNILIERGSGRALVTDFGIARANDDPDAKGRLTREGQMIGTAAFMSPEQGAGEAVDGRTDIYALGGVGYFTLVGRAPFEATTLQAMLVARYTRAAPPVAVARPDIPPALAAAIDRCLAREPHDRYPSAEAVADALSEATGTSGVESVALPVRGFIRAAEQSIWFIALVVVFTLVYGLPSTRRVVPLVAGILFGTAVLCIDLVRRARELLDEGFGAGDVRRGFEVEQKAQAEEHRQLFDARRIAARRRTRRRAWTTLLVGIVIRVSAQIILMHRRWATPVAWALIAVMILLDLINTVTLVVALNTSPRSERRAFRLAAAIWKSRFTVGFFRVAAIGRGRPEARAPATDRGIARLSELLPSSVATRFPELPATIERVESSQASMRLRELEVGRALAEARSGSVSNDQSPAGSSNDAWGTHATPQGQRDSLELRRTALLDEMADTLERTRSRRATLTAALENVRIQLLRIGAGIGSADDMRGEVDTLNALVDR